MIELAEVFLIFALVGFLVAAGFGVAGGLLWFICKALGLI